MFNRIPIKSYLQISFLIFGSLIIVAAGWQAYEIGRTSLEELTYHRLTSVRETKKRQIEYYFEQLRNSIVTMAENSAVLAQTADFRDAGGSVTPSHTKQDADALFVPWLDRFNLNSISIINPASSALVYSTGKALEQGAGWGTPAAMPPGIARIIRSAETAGKVETFVCDVMRSGLPDNEPVIYIAAPIRNSGILHGILLVEISMRHINNIMTDDDEWYMRGMGQSGETYLVGQDHLMRTDSRFLRDTPKRFLKALQRSGSPDDTIRLIRDNRTTILYQRVATEAAATALAGKTGIRPVNDYRGVHVLSSFSPLNVPGLDWAILAEIDTKEAFASITQLQENLILTAIIMVLIAAAWGYALSRRILIPLRQLAAASEHVGRGDLGWRVQLDTKDELGHLAEAFNLMAANLQKMTAALQSEVRVRHEAELELQSSHTQLRKLSAHLQSVTEEERKALAREIHDELGQSLTAIKMDAALMERRYTGGDAALKTHIAGMIGLINDTIISVKRITAELRPGILDDLGLSAAMEWQAEEFRKRTGIHCTVVSDPDPLIVGANVSTALFRIFQETLTNVARHAEASNVRALLTLDNGAVVLQASDDGKGIPPDAIESHASFGILGMRERTTALGGTFEIAPLTDGGTVVRVSIPRTDPEPGQ